MSSSLLEPGLQALGQQPFSVLLGAQLEAMTTDHAEISVRVKPELVQQHGFVHGGVLSYLADNALTFAGDSVLGDSVTAEFKINYLHPVTCPQ